MINCFRYLGYIDFDKVYNLAIRDYELQMKAYKLKREDEVEELYLSAWLNTVVKNRKEDGSPQFEKFSDFYKKSSDIKIDENELEFLKRIAEYNINKKRRENNAGKL